METIARKTADIAVSATCFLYTCYVLCNLTYFLSSHSSHLQTEDASAGRSELPVWWSILVDMSLLSVFMIQHSVMSSEFAKRLFSTLQIEYTNRSVYNVASSLCLHLLLSNWQFVPQVALWRVDTLTSNISWYIFIGWHVLAWSIIYSGCLMVDISELAGLKQIYYKISCLPDPMEIKSRELSRFYSHMRHPSFTGFLIILWIHPFMTIDRILLATVLTAYMTLMWNIDQEDCNYHTMLLRIKKLELS